MNNEKIIEHMIAFVEEKEKDVMSEKFVSGLNRKTDIVNSIIEELESVLKNEN